MGRACGGGWCSSFADIIWTLLIPYHPFLCKTEKPSTSAPSSDLQSSSPPPTDTPFARSDQHRSQTASPVHKQFCNTAVMLLGTVQRDVIQPR